jgi:hypothetical protein
MLPTGGPMTLRRNFVIAFTLAVGMALGYAVRPAAQGVAATPQLTPGSYEVSVEQGQEGRIRITMPDQQTTTRVVEATRFRLFLNSNLLVVTPLNQAGVTVQPEIEPRPYGFALRVPK